MCAPGNQSIYKGCKDIILKQNGNHPLRQREMRAIIKRHGGCMNNRAALDKL